MTTELQRVVDGLAWRLRRNVAVDDQRVRLQAYSSHDGAPVDPARNQSILMREVPHEVVAWVHSAVAASDGEPFRPPLAPQLGITTPRLCVPIRQSGTVVGFVWVLEGDEALTEPEVQTVVEAAETIAVVMQRDRLAEEVTSNRVRDLLRDLVAPDDAPTREHAATELVDADLFVGREPVLVVVVTLHPSEQALEEGERTALTGWLERKGGRLSDRRHLSLVRLDHGLLLLSATDPVVRGDAVLELAEDLVSGLGASMPDAAPFVGLGEAVNELRDAYRSYHQARRAAAVARSVGGLGQVVPFGRLGVYGLLARIPPEELTLDVLPPGLLRLFDAGSKGEPLLATLETYLDLAGDARATAEALFIHRATLYYRLQRIEEWTGLEMTRGDHRLVLHLGLKIARLAGLRES